MHTQICKYDTQRFCTHECDKDICFFTKREDMFFKNNERPNMKGHKIKPKDRRKIKTR